MKLVLANNQTPQFVEYYGAIKNRYGDILDYTNYVSLLFFFDSDSPSPVAVSVLSSGKQLTDYDGVYINGYLDTYELAAATAICANFLGVPFVNHELANSGSLSKLTMYAKLTAAGVSLPKTVAGSAKALTTLKDFTFPAVLKRADADRGIDNYKVKSMAEVESLLTSQEALSIWILQDYVPNDGFYLVSYYLDQASFCIFRSLEERPDGNEQKAHMFKPKGGGNASLIPLPEVPKSILEECSKALKVMDRQIGSVDCIYDSATDKVYILEVNYNPQLVTIETYKQERLEAFVAAMQSDWLPYKSAGKN